MNVNRLKVNARNKLRLFIHQNNMFAYPLHAVASYALSACISDDLFPNVDDNCAARTTNSMLSSLHDAVGGKGGVRSSNFDDNEAIKYTSHSLRSGGATFLHEHPDIKAEFINERGGWSVRGHDHSLRYKWGTAITDGAVGRVLSGWRYIDCGGFVPYPKDIIPACEWDYFRLYATLLFGASNMSDKVTQVFTAVLLMHYKQLLAQPRISMLLDLMVPRQQSFEVGKLSEWSERIMNAFIEDNADNLSRSQVSHLSNNELLERLVQENIEIKQELAKSNAGLNRLLELAELARHQQPAPTMSHHQSSAAAINDEDGAQQTLQQPQNNGLFSLFMPLQSQPPQASARRHVWPS